jgi:tRNA modification GTPase
MIPLDEDLIIARCTPQGPGAIALLRVSGTGARACIDSFARLASGKTIIDLPSHTIHYGALLYDDGSPLDQVMIIVMDAPRTFTGQDVVEITCHNNPFIINAIIEQALKRGARLAQEGEFTKRAFLNKKIDLVQAEAIHELIGAQTQQALKGSLAQLQGSLSQWIVTLETDLIRAVAWCEASFEFLDEQEEFGKQILAAINSTLAHITELKKSFPMQQQIRHGVRIALLGSVNAGKSSLFNALLHQQRAIVTDIAGTTRDSIEAGLSYGGNNWTLVDTAGLRQTADTIEAEGIKRSREEAHKADIIVLIVDRSRPMSVEEADVYKTILEQYPTKTILIQNKADLLAIANPLVAQTTLTVSAHQPETLELIYDTLERKVGELFGTNELPFLLNQRHQSLLLTLEQKLQHTVPLFQGTVQYELISYHLQDALTCLTELTGRSISEASLDMVFKEFCVGK